MGDPGAIVAPGGVSGFFLLGAFESFFCVVCLALARDESAETADGKETALVSDVDELLRVELHVAGVHGDIDGKPDGLVCSEVLDDVKSVVPLASVHTHNALSQGPYDFLNINDAL